MPHANRGTKRRCPHCGAAFYDLDRDPVVCPKCHTPYVESQRPPARATSRSRPAAPRPEEEETEDATAFDEDEVLEREGMDQDALDEEDDSDNERE